MQLLLGVAKSTETYLSTQTHSIINWVKWVLSINPIKSN